MSRTRALSRSVPAVLAALWLLAAAAPGAVLHAGTRHAQRSCLRAGGHAKHAGRRRTRAGRCHAGSRRWRRGAARHHHHHRSHRHRPRRHRGGITGGHRHPLSLGGGCPGATLLPSEADLAVVREATACLVNRQRTRAGEAPLRVNPALAAAAEAHARSMSVHGYFDHVGADGSTPLGRIEASGYLARSAAGFEIGENIAWGSSVLATPASIVAAWMASPGHRANILRRSFRDTGIGVSPQLPNAFADGASGAIYTQDFGAILGR